MPTQSPAVSADTQSTPKNTKQNIAATAPGHIRVIKRNGTVVGYDARKIAVAITKAYLAVEGGAAAESNRVHEEVKLMTDQITATFKRRLPSGGTLHIEEVQDQVELALMRSGKHKVARDYVIYREERAKKRSYPDQQAERLAESRPTINITLEDGRQTTLDIARLQTVVDEACEGLEEVNGGRILTEALRNLYEGVSEKDINPTLVMTARTLIEEEPNYSFVTARLLLDKLRTEALGFLGFPTSATQADMSKHYPNAFDAYIQRGIDLELIGPELAEFDCEQLGKALNPERDMAFTYLGLQILYDRYLIKTESGTRFELPQWFWMRVAMGLAIEEDGREARAIEFYQQLASFDSMTSSPTLFNAGTLRPQLSSYYLTSIPDDLRGIYGAMQDNAMLSKWAGGLGNDWTPVRGLGAYIKGTNGKSQGVVPFLKVANDTAVAVNQDGRRKGAVCAYLETWHIDVEEFLELRKNTGDDRRRTHDMNTANWVPDLFMQRVFEDKEWTLFSPNDVPELHELYGQEFARKYEEYEAKAKAGKLKPSKTVKAVDLWKKMLDMLFETGHPWITFKDACNVRSPQQHKGVVHSSNLCTEITLNTKPNQEIAVCNLGSINMPKHIVDGKLDVEKLKRTVRTSVRMLDNVIDINYYSVPTARTSNMCHRPVGLGLMGFQDALYKLRLPYGSEEAVEFADKSMELISYFAIEASSDLAEERGCYQSYEGSLWDKGIFPIDSIALLKDARADGYLEMDARQTLDWAALREKVKRQGMRNSNVMAIAPTATIANITGVSQSIEPTYQNLYVKSNLSGEFTVVNPYLVRDLKALGLWDSVMVNDLKYYEGSLAKIERIPDDLKPLYATAFEVGPRWIVEAASRRQKWLDQAQSLYLYISGANGKKLDVTYRMAWLRGLKTTYYLRALAATTTEKSTVDNNSLNAVKPTQTPAPEATQKATQFDLPDQSADVPSAYSLDDPDCSACE